MVETRSRSQVLGSGNLTPGGKEQPTSTSAMTPTPKTARKRASSRIKEVQEEHEEQQQQQQQTPQDQIKTTAEEAPQQQQMQPSQKAQQVDHTDYEFFGPHGTAVIIFVLPAVLYGLFYSCNASGCLQLLPQLTVPGFPSGSQIFTLDALLVYFGWMAALVLLHVLLPGQKAQGVMLPDGSRLTYKLNGGCTT